LISLIHSLYHSTLSCSYEFEESLLFLACIWFLIVLHEFHQMKALKETSHVNLIHCVSLIYVERGSMNSDNS